MSLTHNIKAGQKYSRIDNSMKKPYIIDIEIVKAGPKQAEIIYLSTGRAAKMRIEEIVFAYHLIK